MIRHVVLLRFIPGTEPSAIERYAEAVAKLPSQIPEVIDFTSGQDVGKSFAPAMVSNWDFVVSATFDDLHSYMRYATHPDHRALVERFLEGIVSERAAVQIDDDGTAAS